MRLLLKCLLLASLPVVAGGQASTPTGHQFAGLPILGYDADEGVGYGVFVAFYDYGYDGAQPYRYSLQPQVFFTSRGRTDVILFVDAPHLLPSGWRLNGLLGREQQKATPFYGVGNETANISALTAAPNNYYYRFGRIVYQGNADFQHPIFTKPLRALIGLGARNEAIQTVSYDSGTSLLAQTLGVRGTLPSTNTNYGRLGLVVDTRNKEISTTQGTWSELLVQRAGKVAGGDEVFTRITSTLRGYVPLTSKLVLAERVLLQTVHGNPPITDLSFVQSSYRDDEALGGATSIRGIPRNRYVGKGVEFSNTELRWTVTHFTVLKYHTGLVLSSFFDTGRVWADGFDANTIFDGLHAGYGGGVHLEIGPTFVVSGDLAHSSQSTAALYIGTGYLF
jgi:outer membrane protein assembly factor BamA